MTNLFDLPAAKASASASSKEALRNKTFPRQLLRYVTLARPNHYGKNILVLIGILLALAHQPVAITPRLLFTIICGFAATCLIASSNYVLNGILDAEFDRFHPRKHDRPVASGRVPLLAAYVEWLVLGGLGLLLAYYIDWPFFAAAAALAFMGIVYNVPPVRLKDLPYVDVLSEAVNSPIRLMLGWALVLPSEIPDIRLILVFWMAGAFAMAWKRLRELRVFPDRTVAAAYRKSFAHYDERYLKTCMAVYALAAVAFALAW